MKRILEGGAGVLLDKIWLRFHVDVPFVSATLAVNALDQAYMLKNYLCLWVDFFGYKFRFRLAREG